MSNKGLLIGLAGADERTRMQTCIFAQALYRHGEGVEGVLAIDATTRAAAIIVSACMDQMTIGDGLRWMASRFTAMADLADSVDAPNPAGQVKP